MSTKERADATIKELRDTVLALMVIIAEMRMRVDGASLTHEMHWGDVEAAGRRAVERADAVLRVRA